MDRFKSNEIIDNFTKNGGIASYNELKKLGISSFNINMLIKSGKIERTRRGLYRIPESSHELSELIEVTKVAPQGVLCLLSALSWHELTTHIPKEYSLAIPIKARKPVLPNYPPIQLYYYSLLRYSTGQVEATVDDSTVKIYDKEKTLCDIIYYRNKIGQDIVREALDKYLKSKDKNIQKLMKYADTLRVSTVVKKYLEVLI